MPSPASAIVVIKPQKTPHRMPQMSTVRAMINHIYCFMPAANKPTKPEAYPGSVSSSPLSRPPSAGCLPGKCVAKMRLANPFTLSCSSLSDSLSPVHSVGPHRSQSNLPRSPLSFGLVTQKFTTMRFGLVPLLGVVFTLVTFDGNYSGQPLGVYVMLFPDRLSKAVPPACHYHGPPNAQHATCGLGLEPRL